MQLPTAASRECTSHGRMSTTLTCLPSPPCLCSVSTQWKADPNQNHLSYSEAEVQVQRYPSNCHESFTKREEAEAFIERYRETNAKLLRGTSGSQHEVSSGSAQHSEAQAAPATSSAPVSSLYPSTRSSPAVQEPVALDANTPVVGDEADDVPATPGGGRKKGHWRSRNRGRAIKGGRGSTNSLTENMSRLNIRVNVSRV
ncbi:hypothetical protein QBC36DRAFT_320597 [Triangularia setosa]|uniref:Ribonuclease H1 N-terminal domain-containing protein n=1 Tax=Triangularia setosa TaxID=2587417 RepID=A0AAN6WHF0_9PEZI|nr:hypothetical protein QBC36DRAFT_320597 [Podospora setosa]